MNLEDLFKLSTFVIGSLGSAGAIVIGFSSWLGKVWANRLMETEKSKHQRDIILITEEIKYRNNIELEKLKAQIEASYITEKLDKTHEHEQRKMIKEVISKNKVNILDAAEALNHRMWNFSDNHSKNWHTKNGRVIDEQYYLYSFVYRLLAFFAWCSKVEKEMVYLDSTIAEEKDLDFVKFLKLLPQVMCDVSLFNGLTYDSSHDIDHFYKNNFQSAVNQICTDSGIISFDEFKIKVETNKIKVDNVVSFLSGINPQENRLRWFRLDAMHFVLLMFINTFGYDFQYTDISKVQTLLTKNPKNKTISNSIRMITDFKLHENKEVKLITPVINT